jgi:predicted XRE-type DNA-binding protein
MSSREVVEIVGLSQSKVNRIMKKHFENIVMSRGGRPQVLIT